MCTPLTLAQKGSGVVNQRDAKHRAHNLAGWIIGKYVKQGTIYKDITDEEIMDVVKINHALEEISQALYRRG